MQLRVCMSDGNCIIVELHVVTFLLLHKKKSQCCHASVGMLRFLTLRCSLIAYKIYPTYISQGDERRALPHGA